MLVDVEKIFELLHKMGSTQKMLSDSINVSTGNVTDWKKGKSKPSAPVLLKIAKYLNVPVESLYIGNNESIKEMPKSASLTTSQAEIVELYDSLNQEGQAQALSYLRFLKKESVSALNDQGLDAEKEYRIYDVVQDTESDHSKGSRKPSG